MLRLCMARPGAVGRIRNPTARVESDLPRRRTRMRPATPVDRSPQGARRPAGRLTLLGLAALLTLTACSGFTAKVSRRFGGEVSFGVELDPRLNRDFPLAVDFAIVYDKDLYKEVQDLTAEEWFSKRDQYRLDNEPAKLEIHSWEWVPPCADCPAPGTQVVDHRLGARGGVIFANYFNAGEHRIVIEPLKAFSLELGETEAGLGPRPDRKQRKAEKKDAKAEKKRARRAKKKARKG